MALVTGSGEDGDSADFVQRPGSRLIKVQSVGLAAFGSINPHTASALAVSEAFGEPASTAMRGEGCRRAWPSLGLTIAFAAAGGGDPCAEEAHVRRLQLAGRRAAQEGWRTAEGIRPLQALGEVRGIYPEAPRARAGRLVLVAPPGGEAGGGPVMIAAISGGRIERLSFPIDAPSG